MVQLNTGYRLARHFHGKSLLPHLRVEELRQGGLVAGQLNVANVKPLALSNRVTDTTHSSSSSSGESGASLEARSSRETGVAMHRRDRLSVGSRSRELP